MSADTNMTKSGIVRTSQSLDSWALQQKNCPLSRPSATPASTPATPPRSTVHTKGYRYPSNPAEFSGDRIMTSRVSLRPVNF